MQTKILILRGGAIGDFVLTMPAMQALRAAWPDATIELAGYPHIANLALAGGLVDKVISLDRREFATIFSRRPEIDSDFLEYVLGFEIILSYLYDPDGFAVGNLRSAGGKHVIYGNPIVEKAHAIDHFLAPLAELDLAAAPPRHAELILAEDVRASAHLVLAECGEDVVLLHPGSGSPGKNWPTEKFVELAFRLLGEAACAPVFSLGEADEEVAVRLKELAPHVPVITGLSLVELAAAISHCRAYVGNDAGITHLAAATGVPVVAIFGPTDPAIWAPRGPNVTVVRAKDACPDALTAVSVEEVLCACRTSMA